jgi:hypothetical protein
MRPHQFRDCRASGKVWKNNTGSSLGAKAGRPDPGAHIILGSCERITSVILDLKALKQIKTRDCTNLISSCEGAGMCQVTQTHSWLIQKSECKGL